MSDTSTAPAQTLEQPPATSQSLETLSQAEREQWELTGELPNVAPSTGDVEEPGVSETVPPVATESARVLSKRQQEINDHVRAKVLAEQRAEAAERRLAEFDAKAAKSEPTGPAQLPADEKEPTLDDFLAADDPYLAYTRAITKYDTAQELKTRDTARDQRDRARREQDEAVQRFTAYQAREDALKALHPDFDAKTGAVRAAIDVRTPLGSALLESEVAPSLILHFADHPDDFERIGRLGVLNPGAALRELGRLEAKYDTGAAPASAAPPPLKSVTSAPPPPATLGTRPADVADEADAAVARGDVRAYMDAENRKEMARIGRR